MLKLKDLEVVKRTEALWAIHNNRFQSIVKHFRVKFRVCLDVLWWNVGLIKWIQNQELWLLIWLRKDKIFHVSV